MLDRGSIQQAEVIPFPADSDEPSEGGLLMGRRQAAAFLGISPSLLTQLSPEINPRIAYIRLTPGGAKYWTKAGLEASIDRLYLDQVPRHLLPTSLLDVA
jgi:hypothetical protein